jgi:hypothetical protein
VAIAPITLEFADTVGEADGAANIHTKPAQIMTNPAIAHRFEEFTAIILATKTLARHSGNRLCEP